MFGVPVKDQRGYVDVRGKGENGQSLNADFFLLPNPTF